MKILALRGQNLASLAAPFELDFTAAPLKHAGVYAICGPTGAGKSTLLDALCLALYHRTPRLDEGSTLSLLDVGGEALGSKDARQWLRRGAAAGFAEVDFVGIDGAAWRARWSVKRARGSPKGRLQAAEASLERLDNGELRGRTISEVREEIKACVGLDFAQFTRAVLLAQNQFARFLSADANERAQLLEALTGAQVYSKLSVAAFTRARDSRQQLAVLEQGASMLTLLSDEQLQALQTALETGNAREASIQTELQPIAAALAWHERRTELQAQQQSAQQRWQNAQLQVQSRAEQATELQAWIRVQDARMLQQRLDQSQQQLAFCTQRQSQAQAQHYTAQEQLQLAREALALAASREAQAAQALRDARPQLKQARELDQHCVNARVALQHAQGRLEEQRRAVAEVEDERQGIGLQVDVLQRQLQQTRDWCLAHAEDAALAQSWQRLELLIDTTLRTRRALQEALDRREALRAQWQQAKTQLQGLAAQREQQQQQVREAEQQMVALQEQLKQLRPDDLPATQQAQHRAEQDLQRAQHTLGLLQASSERLRELDTQCRDRQQQVEQWRAQLEALEQQLPILTAQALTCARLSAQAQARVDQRTVAMRAQLEPEQPCPVCGATEHPYLQSRPAADAPVAELLADLERASREAAAQLQTAQSTQLTLQTRLQDAALRQPEQLRAQNQARADVDQLRLELLQVWPDAPAELPEAASALELWTSNVQQAGARWEARQREVQQAQRAERTAQQSLLSHRTALDTCNQEHERAAAAHQQVELQGQLLTQECQGLQRSLQESHNELQQHPGWPLDHDPVALTEEVRSSLAGRVRVWIEQQANLQKSENTLQLQQQQWQQRSNRLEHELLPVLHQLEQQAQLALQAEQLSLAARKELHPELDTERWQQQLEAALELAQAELARLRMHETNAASAHHRTNVELATAAQAAQAAQQQYAQAQAALAQWLAAWPSELPGIDHAQLLHWLHVPVQHIEQRRLELAGLQQALQSAQLAAQHVTLQLEEWLAAGVDHPPQDALLHTRQLLEDEQRALLQQRGALQEQLSHDQQTGAQQLSLQAQIEAAREAARIWAQLSDLIGSADGAKFRKLAQQYTLDLVLAYANVHLQELAARYQLRREAEHLLVQDADLGGAIRVVSSLSGGESFLVSLALALGLASLTAQRMRIESLFIDEGFGALDEANLRLALDALDRLQAQGRKIGVISHLSELTERISTRIEVRRIAPGTSEVHVLG